MPLPQRQPVSVKGVFSGIENARSLVDANYIKPGHYWMLIRRTKVDQTRKRETFAAIEFTVVQVMDDDDGKGHRIGQDVTHLIKNAGTQADYFLPTIKAFIAAIMEMQPEDISEADAELAFGPEQPLTGTVVEVQGREILKKDKKADDKDAYFTRIKYLREVKTAELLSELSPEIQTRFFPNDILTKKLEIEQQQAA